MTVAAPTPTPLAVVVAATLASPTAIPAPVPRAIGCTRICAYEQGGADITGKAVCNAALQKSIDALPQAGGEVHLPAGKYLIDAVAGIKLRSNLRLHLDDGAEIIVQPNNQIRYYALPVKGVHDVEILGGKLTGDRDGHTYAKQKTDAQNTHEWGFGVAILDSQDVTVRGITINGFTGDGVYLSDNGGEVARVQIINIVSTNNRRQGMSAVKASDIDVISSEFSYTNGTAPECGVDIEPEGSGISQNIRFFGCHIHSNNANGLLALRRPDVSCVVTNILVAGCVIENNKGCGVYGANVDKLDVFQNTITGNDQSGINVSKDSTNVHISENTFSHNYDRGQETVKARAAATVTGLLAKYEMDILNRAKDPSQVFVGRNTYN